MRTRVLAALVAALALGASGCVEKMLRDEQLKSARAAAGAADTVADYEAARSAAASSVMQVEGMHRLAPESEDALYLLLRGWTTWGYAFAEDDAEVARLAGDEANAEYHKKRVKLAYDRAIAYGLELLAHEDGGFEAARKSPETMRAWLEKHFADREHAEPLLWLGTAWLGRSSLEPDLANDAYVGVAMLERSLALRPDLAAWSAAARLGAWYARAPRPDLDHAKKLLDLALEKTKHRSLPVLLDYARYACTKADEVLYEKTLNEILAAEDLDPSLRLPNVIAKRRAKRALAKDAMAACGFARAPAVPPAAR